jgi:hypothetical protein
MNWLDQWAIGRVCSMIGDAMEPLSGYKTYILAVISIIVFMLKPWIGQFVSPDQLNNILQLMGFGAVITFRLGMDTTGWASYVVGLLGITIVVAEAVGVVSPATAVQFNGILFGTAVFTHRRDIKLMSPRTL